MKIDYWLDDETSDELDLDEIESLVE